MFTNVSNRWYLLDYEQNAQFIFQNAIEEKNVFRRTRIDGVLLLDGYLPFQFPVQPTLEDFKSSFSRLSLNALNGLDWSNILVAGGFVLRSLFLKDPDRTFNDSDLDVFIFGLGPREANEKIKHIYNVWVSNLPPGVNHRVLLNHRTITFVV